jgi:predicted kinase
MAASPRPLAALYNRRTSYEVAIYDGANVVAVVAFTQRRTRDCLLRLAYENRAALTAMMAPAEMDQAWRYDAKAGRVHFGARAAIGFTGATEYERASQAAMVAA